MNAWKYTAAVASNKFECIHLQRKFAILCHNTFFYHDRDVLEDIHLQTLLTRRHSLGGLFFFFFIYGSIFLMSIYGKGIIYVPA